MCHIMSGDVFDLVLARPSWHSTAACVDSLDVMFGRGTQRAHELCAECDHTVVCRQDADLAESGLPVAQVFGIVAGENPAERVARRRLEAVTVVAVDVSAPCAPGDDSDVLDGRTDAVEACRPVEPCFIGHEPRDRVLAVFA